MNTEPNDEYSKVALLKTLYLDPDDQRMIQELETKLSELEQLKSFAEHPFAKILVQKCSLEVVAARKRLCMDRQLLDDEPTQRALWNIIDARLWFIKLVGADLNTQMAFIQSELDREIARANV